MRGWKRAGGGGGRIGCLWGSMGIGGGALSVPVMRLSGCSIHRGVGTAAALGLVIALPGAAGGRRGV